MVCRRSSQVVFCWDCDIDMGRCVFLISKYIYCGWINMFFIYSHLISHSMIVLIEREYKSSLLKLWVLCLHMLGSDLNSSVQQDIKGRQRLELGISPYCMCPRQNVFPRSLSLALTPTKYWHVHRFTTKQYIYNIYTVIYTTLRIYNHFTLDDGLKVVYAIWSESLFDNLESLQSTWNKTLW